MTEQNPDSTPSTGGRQGNTRRRRSAGVLAGTALLAAVVGAAAGIGSYGYLGDHSGGSSSSSVRMGSGPTPQSTTSAAPGGSGSIEHAASTIKSSVVTIVLKSGSSGDLGSGVVLDHKGHILTNAHVVSPSQSNAADTSGSGASKMTVTFSNGKTTKAKIVGVDKSDDLAVIEAAEAKNTTPATFAKSAKVKAGQSVVAVGAPLGLSQTVTQGIVSNTHRPVSSGKGHSAFYEAIQTDASINPGNSGGPLVNVAGQVVGINSAIRSTKSSGRGGGQSGSIGIGFAIPSDIATRVSGQLIDKGKAAHAALGVTISAREEGKLAGTTTGVELKGVKSGRPADKAGLETGDKITKLNHFQVNTSKGLIAATRYYAPGTKVTIKYLRHDTSHTAHVTLGKS